MRTIVFFLTLLLTAPAQAYYFTMENTGAYSGISHLTLTVLYDPYAFDPSDALTFTTADLGFTTIMPGETFTSGTLDTQGHFPVVLYGIGYDAGSYTYKHTCCTYTEGWPEGGYGFTLNWLNGSSPSSVPEPATGWLLLTGLLGIVLFKSAQYCSGVTKAGGRQDTGLYGL